MAKVKICGLRRYEDIKIVNECLPDYVGFIINYPKSFRSVSVIQVQEMVKELDPSIQTVGVFVDEEIENVIKCIKETGIDLVQLHGHESDKYIKTIQQYVHVIKAFEIRNEIDIQKAIESPADYVLLDQGKGGGKSFDWSLIPKIERPFFLAGGITLENIDKIKDIDPYAIDVSSSVETERVKDKEKVKLMIKKGKMI